MNTPQIRLINSISSYIMKCVHSDNMIRVIYNGYKVVPYDPRIGATLSSHEVAQGYKEVEDPSITVRLPVKGEDKTSFLVWTTTPWTLPSNLLLAVGEDIDYAKVRYQDETLIQYADNFPFSLADAE